MSESKYVTIDEAFERLASRRRWAYSLRRFFSSDWPARLSILLFGVWLGIMSAPWTRY